ncbi:MAG: hypothetical protein IH848_10245, partial [Acidobacteria bacterium]|nr:hypothetical protein [Acidobacteriota bacterium]
MTDVSGAKCFGTNIFGQLGDGTTTNRASPVNVSGLESGVAAVAGGHNHTCALTTAGGVKCWGDNSYGQLGDGTTTDRTTPVNVFGLGSGVTAIAAGGFHTCALKAGGSLVCWGRNVYGQVGDGASGEPNFRTTPTAVVGMGSGVAAVATGTFHTCARTTGGAVKCWGWNFYGQIGDGTNLSRATPTTVAVSGVTLLETGSTHSCVIITGGSVTCWGDNEFGQAGDGTTESVHAPVNVIGLPGAVTTITGGSDHTCAITEAGGLLCWGRNDGGQLGDGTGITSPAPVSVLGLNPKPTHTPTATPTRTPTPTVTPTPKDGAADTDGDTVPNSTDLDDDNDGCTDSAEVGSTAGMGGLRNPHDVWDFFDTPDPNALPERDKAHLVALYDGEIAWTDSIVGRFGTLQKIMRATIDDLDDRKRHIKLSGDDIALLNPNTRTCPIFRSRRDAAVTKRIYRRIPILMDHNRKAGGNPWGIKFATMFHQTNDAELFIDPETLAKKGYRLEGNRWTKKRRTYLPLYEAKMFRLYDHRHGTVFIDESNWINQGQTTESTLVQHQNPEHVVLPRWWAPEETIRDRLGGTTLPAMLAFRDITRSTDDRTMIATLLPFAGAINTAPLMLSPVNPRLLCCLLANLNSRVLDYVA